MKTYAVHGYLTISVFKEIKANSKKEARSIAEGLEIPGLCYQCDSAGEYDKDSWMLNGFGDPPDDCIQDISECE